MSGWAIFGQAMAEAGAQALNWVGAEKTRRFDRKMWQKNADLQREFAQNGIRWRVEDAKRAGLHPLYALGAQPIQATPMAVQDSMGPALSEMGQGLRRVAATVAEQRAQDLQLKALEKNLEESDARIGLLHSEAARNYQEAMGTPPLPDAINPTATPYWANNFPRASGGLPAEDLSYGTMGRSFGTGVSSEAASPLWRRFKLADGMEAVLPTASNDAAEALESLSESHFLMWITYQENKRLYGENWADAFAERYFIPEMWRKVRGMNWEEVSKTLGRGASKVGEVFTGGK